MRLNGKRILTWEMGKMLLNSLYCLTLFRNFEIVEVTTLVNVATGTVLPQFVVKTLASPKTKLSKTKNILYHYIFVQIFKSLLILRP